MNKKIDISSYVESPKMAEQRASFRQPTKRVPVISNTRQAVLSQPILRRPTSSQNNADLNKQTTRSGSITGSSVDRRTLASTTFPKMPATRYSTIGQTSQRSSSLRPKPLDASSSFSSKVSRTSPDLETENELREELKRLHSAFHLFRKETYNRLETVMKTNASLTEEIGDLKIQFNSNTSRFSRKSVPVVDTDKLLAELSSKLIESPEFKESVLNLIEEHNEKLAEKEKEEEMLLKPPLSELKRPTTIRDESCYLLADDEVEIIEDENPFLQNIEHSPKRSESFTSPQESDSQDSQDNSNNNEYSADEENDDPINQTFTISDDESKSRNLFNKENSPRFLNRPVVDSKTRRFSAAGSQFAQTKPSDNNKSSQMMTRRRTALHFR
ncbi:hypothetical protein M3Y97_00289400 [Aphelenchoides bicaudatus]|nr:hypothetical protein M3Y97_00289400 [Aphelenchoides bicaudatus]